MQKCFLILLSIIFISSQYSFAESKFEQPFKDKRTDILENPDMPIPTNGSWLGPWWTSQVGSKVHKETMLTTGDRAYVWTQTYYNDESDVSHYYLRKHLIDCKTKKISKQIEKVTWNDINREKIIEKYNAYESDMDVDRGYMSDDKLIIKEVCKALGKWVK